MPRLEPIPMDELAPASRRIIEDGVAEGLYATPVGVEVAPRVWSADGAPLPKDVAVEGPVYLGADVRIGAGASIEPYAVIYDSCRIAAGATVGDAILWPGCTVGERGTVRGAILGLDVAVDPAAAVPAGAVLGRGERVSAAR